ncbi:MAG: N-acetylmuramoyl-L-alanine amidase [Anaerocolumna sp.]
MDKRVKRRIIIFRRRMTFIGIVSLLILFASIWNNSRQDDNSKSDGAKERTFKDTSKNDGAAKGMVKVVIDPGHGGIDVGATGASGLYEKDFTLSLSKKIKEVLEKEEKIQVYMIREDDTFISTEDNYRSKFANELEVDLYISIHGNTYEDPNVSGTESFYYHKEFKSFAETMHKNVVSATGFNDRGVKKGDLFVVRDTDMPSVLLEIGYLTNPQEEQTMLNEEFQDSVTEAIGNGVKEYLEIYD